MHFSFSSLLLLYWSAADSALPLLANAYSAFRTGHTRTARRLMHQVVTSHPDPLHLSISSISVGFFWWDLPAEQLTGAYSMKCLLDAWAAPSLLLACRSARSWRCWP